MDSNEYCCKRCIGVLERVLTMLNAHAECKAQWWRPHRQQELGISGAVSCLEAWPASAFNLLCKVVRHVVMSTGTVTFLEMEAGSCYCQGGELGLQSKQVFSQAGIFTLTSGKSPTLTLW